VLDAEGGEEPEAKRQKGDKATLLPLTQNVLSHEKSSERHRRDDLAAEIPSLAVKGQGKERALFHAEKKKKKDTGEKKKKKNKKKKKTPRHVKKRHKRGKRAPICLVQSLGKLALYFEKSAPYLRVEREKAPSHRKKKEMAARLFLPRASSQGEGRGSGCEDEKKKGEKRKSSFMEGNARGKESSME